MWNWLKRLFGRKEEQCRGNCRKLTKPPAYVESVIYNSEDKDNAYVVSDIPECLKMTEEQLRNWKPNEIKPFKSLEFNYDSKYHDLECPILGPRKEMKGYEKVACSTLKAIQPKE